MVKTTENHAQNRTFSFSHQGEKKPNCRITTSYPAISSSFVRRNPTTAPPVKPVFRPLPSHREGQTNLSESKSLAIVFLKIFCTGQNREIPNIHAVIRGHAPPTHPHPALNNVPAHAKKSSEFHPETHFHRPPQNPRRFPGTKRSAAASVYAPPPQNPARKITPTYQLQCRLFAMLSPADAPR